MSEAAGPNWKDNSVGFMRLLLASIVLLGHAPVLRDMYYENHPNAVARVRDTIGMPFGGQFGWGELAVVGFFFLSGMLITRSWEGAEAQGLGKLVALKTFVGRRFLRIYPGFWVCLLVCGFILAPLAVWLDGGSLATFPWIRGHDSALNYFVQNFTLRFGSPTIGGAFHGHGFDYPLWTLLSEFGCYLLTAVLGLLGLGKRWRWVYLVITLGLGIYLSHIRIPQLLDPEAFPGFVPGRQYHLYAYLLGVVTYYFAEAIPLHTGALVLGLVVWGVSSREPALSYLNTPAFCACVYVLAFRLPMRNIERRADFSYGIYIYGYPIQQLLPLVGGAQFGMVPYLLLTAVCLVPMAALSWFFVEKPAMRLRTRFEPRRAA